jgi:hypothetical protein
MMEIMLSWNCFGVKRTEVKQERMKKQRREQKKIKETNARNWNRTDVTDELSSP